MVLIDPGGWPDKYEGAVAKTLFEQEPEYIRARVRAICFSTKQASYALWRIFGAPGPVIRLRFVTTALEKALGAYTSDGAKTYFVPVRYLSAKEVRTEIKSIKQRSSVKAKEAARIIGMKRDIFEYENEIRVVRITRDRIENAVRIPIQSGVIDQIRIDPYVPASTAATLRAVFQTVCKDVIDIRQSELDHDPLSQ